LYDYAVSGAVCSSTFSPTIRSGVKEDQIPTFLADNVYVNNNTGKIILDNPSDETIYAVWIGTNDLGNRAFLTDVQPSGVHITSYIDCVYEQIDRLHQIGARHFVLMNIAPLHLTPQYALPENGGVTNSSFWKDKTTYNANITQTSEKIRQYVGLVNKIYDFQTPHEVKVAKRYPGSSFAVFDVHSLVSRFLWQNFLISRHPDSAVRLLIYGNIHHSISMVLPH
jgi:phospholipase/lecithinase/hemolysin